MATSQWRCGYCGEFVDSQYTAHTHAYLDDPRPGQIFRAHKTFTYWRDGTNPVRERPAPQPSGAEVRGERKVS